MTAKIPPFGQLLLPTLRAVESLGGSASIPEMETAVVQIFGFSDRQLDVLHNGGPQTKVGYRIAWARTYLKYFGLLTNSSRGVWVLTEAGEQFLEDPALTEADRFDRLLEMKAEKIRQDALARAARSTDTSAQAEPDESDSAAENTIDTDDQLTWKQRLIEKLTSDSFTPKQFERLAQRLLRESGFTSVKVTGGPERSGYRWHRRVPLRAPDLPRILPVQAA